MKRHIVDASVVAAAFFQEEHANAARSLLASGEKLNAPDLIIAEVANVVWKRWRRGEVDEGEARDLLVDFLRLPLRLTPGTQLVTSALDLAMQLERTVYDCLYLALAVKLKSRMVTGDQRLVNALAGTPLEEHITWIGSR